VGVGLGDDAVVGARSAVAAAGIGALVGFEVADAGALPVPAATDTIIGGHCVVLSGYDYSAARFPKPAFQVDNSWGTGWGMGGRFWMDADWFAPRAGLASDLWVIEKVA